VNQHLSLVLLALGLGILSAELWVGFLLVTGRVRRSDALPYGPHLLFGALLAFVLGGP
jgi:leader peptidase (prepilin peptidase)/N-methyltransferase